MIARIDDHQQQLRANPVVQPVQPPPVAFDAAVNALENFPMGALARGELQNDRRDRLQRMIREGIRAMAQRFDFLEVSIGILARRTAQEGVLPLIHQDFAALRASQAARQLSNIQEPSQSSALSVRFPRRVAVAGTDVDWDHPAPICCRQLLARLGQNDVVNLHHFGQSPNCLPAAMVSLNIPNYDSVDNVRARMLAFVRDNANRDRVNILTTQSADLLAELSGRIENGLSLEASHVGFFAYMTQTPCTVIGLDDFGLEVQTHATFNADAQGPRAFFVGWDGTWFRV